MCGEIMRDAKRQKNMTQEIHLLGLIYIDKDCIFLSLKPYDILRRSFDEPSDAYVFVCVWGGVIVTGVGGKINFENSSCYDNLISYESGLFELLLNWKCNSSREGRGKGGIQFHPDYFPLRSLTIDGK